MDPVPLRMRCITYAVMRISDFSVIIREVCVFTSARLILLDEIIFVAPGIIVTVTGFYRFSIINLL